MTLTKVASSGPLGALDRRWPIVLVPAGMALVAVLSFLFLGKRSLWFDEAYSVEVARLSWGQLWSPVAAEQAFMGLYYALLHIWLALGENEVAVRSLSVVAAVATIPAMFSLALRLFGRTTATFAVLLLAMNALFIRYAQEARGYTLVLLLVTVSSYLFLRAMERPSAIRWLLYILTSVAAVYAQLFAALVVLAHFVSLASFPRRSLPIRALASTYGTIAILVSPLAVFLLTRDVPLVDWLTRPTLSDLVGVFASLSGRSVALLISYFLASLLGLAAGLGVVRFGSSALVGRWRLAFVLSWLFVPILGSFAFSLTVKPIFLARYLIVSLPPLVLLVALGLAAIRPVWIRAGSLLVVLGLAGYSLVSWYSGGSFEDWRGATRYMLANSRPGDGIVFDPLLTSRIPLAYYIRIESEEARAPEPLYPSAGWRSNVLVLAGSTAIPDLNSALGPSGPARLWLVQREADISSSELGASSVQTAIEGRYRRVDEPSFTQIRLVLYEPG